MLSWGERVSFASGALMLHAARPSEYRDYYRHHSAPPDLSHPHANTTIGKPLDRTVSSSSLYAL